MMNDILAMTKRNCLMFFRDKASVFFSLLGVLIVIALYLMFLRTSVINTVINSMGDFGTCVNRMDVEHMVDSWVLAGVLAVVSVTTSAGALQTMVQDRLDKKTSDLNMTSLSPVKTSVAYILSTYAVGQIMSIITFVIVIAYLVITGCPLSFEGCLLTVLVTIPASLSGTIIIYALTCRMKSLGAFLGLFIAMSVLIGFLTGIYMPMGSMNSVMQTIGTLMPATHIASIMRQTLGYDALNHLMVGVPSTNVEEIRLTMGYDLELFGYQFTPLTSMIYIIAVTLVFFVIAVLLMRKSND